MTTTVTPVDAHPHDYSLTGPSNQYALDHGLASGQWYRTPIPRERMKELMQRKDEPAIRDTVLWLASFVVFGGIAAYLYPSWWSVPFFLAYGVLYGSSTDSRWHECGHRTAFKTVWMNDWVYQLACFMIMREPEVWRWSHTRHHTDTIIVGRDPEIAVMRPTIVLKVIALFFGIPQVYAEIGKMFQHASGVIDSEEATFIPESERPKVILTARIWVAIHLGVIALALVLHSWLPVLLVGPLPTMYGAWLHVVTGLTQHAGLAEDVLDHRLNSRTVYMNPVLRFLYWNMNYHIEHHMFPMVPYHALPDLHTQIKDDLPRPYSGLIETYAEIIPAVIRQIREPGWCVKRELPPTARPFIPAAAAE
jgi:fatty acid desaturase